MALAPMLQPTMKTEAALPTVEQLVADAGDLAALPQVVMRVVDLTLDPKATAADLERVLGTDQAMAAKILTLANSSYYGLPRRISSLREAVVFLGFKSVRNLAMAITTFNLFLGKADNLSLVRRALWRHSLDTAQCARVAAGRLHPADREAFAADEAFTGGLLHDIGKMLLDRQLPDVFRCIVEEAAARGVPFREVECEFLPFDHGQAGEALALKWNLPPSLCQTVACHHAPHAAEVNPKLTATVSLANDLAHFSEPVGADGPPHTLESLAEQTVDALAVLNLTVAALPGMAAACRVELDKGLCQMAFG